MSSSVNWSSLGMKVEGQRTDFIFPCLYLSMLYKILRHTLAFTMLACMWYHEGVKDLNGLFSLNPHHNFNVFVLLKAV